MKNVLEERLKAQHDSVDKMHKLMEQYENSLSLHNLRFSERYLKGEIEIGIGINGMLQRDSGQLNLDSTSHDST
jgi:hypothetical protein